MPLPLPKMYRVLLHMEWLALVIYQPELGGKYQDPGGTPQSLPQVKAQQEPIPSREAQQPPLRIGELQSGR